MSKEHKPLISVVVPLYCEEDNVSLLVEEVCTALQEVDYELILIDDGSDDATFAAIEEASKNNDRITGIQLRRNFGQTAAMTAGFDAASGAFIAYMDGDLQTDPADILKLMQRLQKDDLDLVNGWRKDRQDAAVSRTLPSKLANALIRFSTGVSLNDNGCPMKVMRSEVGKNLRIYGEQHRFIPALAALFGARIGEEVVSHRPRRFGVSKYGIGRTIRVLVDLLLVMFFLRFTDRPLQLFGPAGVISFVLGTGINLLLTLDKLLFGSDLAGRPLLQLGSLLIVSGILLFGTGLILEMQARIYYESTDRKSYTVRRLVRNFMKRSK
ncbi:MAG: glycosyltransferase family 2 protein [Mariprofundaceae bacterium]